MGHHHHHQPVALNRAFGISVVLNLAFVVVEALAGFWSQSLALLADAGHNLSDVLALLLAWGAFWLGTRAPTRRHSYGMRRASILSALFSALLLILAMGAIGWEALQRIRDPAPVAGMTVIVVASIGVVINTLTAVLLHRVSGHDLNVRAAFLHMAGDAAVSAGVVLAGIGILFSQWYWLDPAISLLIVVLILISAWHLAKESLGLAMDAVPTDIDPDKVHAFLKTQPGVEAVHDLHIWGLSTTETALTAHLVMPDADNNQDVFLTELSHALEHEFNIRHATIQVEHDASGSCCSGSRCYQYES